MSIDGVRVANDGTIPLRAHESITMDYVAWSKFAGDTVSLSILRDGKQMSVDEPLVRERRVVPLPEYDKKPSYYIFGGLLFVPLTMNYLLAWNEISQAPTQLTKFLIDNFNVKDEDAQVVVLAKVLGDDINIGYQQVCWQTVEKVDGTSVRNLKHLIALVEEKKDGPARFDMSDHVPVILDRRKASKAITDILERYRIHSDRSDDMR